jgi:xanthine dehydrogenase accessory factor
MESILSHRNLYIDLEDFLLNQKSCVIATVAETHGSTPQKQGSSAIFGEGGLIEGTVGGGLVEHTIQEKAAKAILSKESGYYRFELNDDINEEDSVICGGGMNILIDAVPEKHLPVWKALKKDYQNRTNGVLATLAHPSADGFEIERIWLTRENFNSESGKLHQDVREQADKMLDEPVPGDFKEFTEHTSPNYEDSFFFLESIVPLPQLIIAGAGHVGKALSHLGKLLDFEVTVWDDREEFANTKNLPDAENVLSGKLENSLAKMNVKRDTFIVIVTRGHRQDSDVLKLFIKSDAGYIGMIGSRKKVAQVRHQFLKNGWATEEQWNKIHSPIGIKIGSKSVQEIAVSIAAELIQVRNELNKMHG